MTRLAFILLIVAPILFAACDVTPTPAPTPTDAPTATGVPSATATQADTPTPTSSPTSTDTATAIPTETDTPSPSLTPTLRPSATATDTPTATARVTPSITSTPPPMPTECTVTISSSQRIIEGLIGEYACFEPRSNGVNIRNSHNVILDFTGVTMKTSGVFMRFSSTITVLNLKVHASQKGVIGLQALSVPDLTVRDCDMDGVYIGVHHKNDVDLGPDDSLGVMTVENCIIVDAIHEGVYLGVSGSRFNQNTVVAFTEIHIIGNIIINSGWDCMQCSSNYIAEIINNECRGFGASPQDGEEDQQTRGINIQRRVIDAPPALVRNNLIDATTSGWDGIVVRSQASADIQGNTIIRSGHRGVQVYANGRASLTDNVIEFPALACWGGSGRIEIKSGNECRR